ncbi:hypothetical protein Dda_8133 [Drechslerella dactyloides]|uniref:Retrovirus-related Pol polyprotein from transposon TNT 1-94-like beta-barrel domain-containing protein n=1 Tax=Drechslerella dactyloides TaxID=74499 RepID=A0AAD6NGD6_DREDA|nr:hypothetical protein Dda_8133 [Drechslerella dactyloides]
MAASTNNLSNRSTDWVFGSGSNVHGAADISWFTSYTAFPSKTTSGLDVLGVGTVKLKVKCDLSGTLNEIELQDVLHVPSMICNLVGNPVIEQIGGFQIGGFGREIGGKIVDESGKCEALLSKPSPLYMLTLSDNTPGRTTLDPAGHYWINVCWADEERARFKALTGQNQPAESHEAKGKEISGDLPLTQEEEQWLKKHWGGEFHFLMAYGWKIYNEEDREDGRKLMRAFMEEDRLNAGQEEEDEHEHGFSF